MAAYTANTAKSATLTSTTQDTVAFAGTGHDIQVINADAVNALWVKVADTDPGALTAGGDDTFRVVAGTPLTISARGIMSPVVRLLGNGGGYTVQAVPAR